MIEFTSWITDVYYTQLILLAAQNLKPTQFVVAQAGNDLSTFVVFRKHCTMAPATIKMSN